MFTAVTPTFRTNKYIDDKDLSGYTFSLTDPLTYVEGDDTLAFILKNKQDNISDISEPNSVLTTDNEGFINWVEIDNFLSGATGGDTITGQTLADGTVDGSFLNWYGSTGRWSETPNMTYNPSTLNYQWGINNSVTGVSNTVYGLNNNVLGGFTNLIFGVGNNIILNSSLVGGQFNTITGDNEYCVIIGEGNVANNDGIFILSQDSYSDGAYSTILGRGHSGTSFAEVVVGTFSEPQSASSKTQHNVNDRVFTVGNGSTDNNKSNSTIIWKSGYHEFNGTINIGNTTGGTGSSPKAGDMRFNTSTNKHQGYDGTTWNDMY